MKPGCAASCGLDQLARMLARALERAAGGRRAHVLSSGGCAGYVAGLLPGEHHRVPLGRCLPFASGLASARPGEDVLAVIGDGEAAGVGAHHLLHAARRGDRVRALVVNNEVLEGAGGFPSPTTPRGGRTAAVPGGSLTAPLDLAELARCAGAAWVGRETLASGPLLDRLLEEFLGAPPFALLEVRAPCYPAYGQWNGYATPEAMREDLERRAMRGGSERPRSEAPGKEPRDGPARFRAGRLWPPPAEDS